MRAQRGRERFDRTRLLDVQCLARGYRLGGIDEAYVTDAVPAR